MCNHFAAALFDGEAQRGRVFFSSSNARFYGFYKKRAY